MMDWFGSWESKVGMDIGEALKVSSRLFRLFHQTYTVKSATSPGWRGMVGEWSKWGNLAKCKARFDIMKQEDSML
jgi:hypothetical protein